MKKIKIFFFIFIFPFSNLFADDQLKFFFHWENSTRSSAVKFVKKLKKSNKKILICFI